MTIYQWQQAMKQQPQVWVVEDSDGIVSGIYASREDAQLEVDSWAKQRARFRAVPWNVHSRELARERWLGGLK